MTAFNGSATHWSDWTNQRDEMILYLWRQGKDTVDIARTLGMAEAMVANRLPRLREAQ